MKKLLFIATVLLPIFCFVYGCNKKDTTNVPGANAVWMQNTAFTPSTLTVPVNTTVTWTNKDGITHNVTSDSGWFSSGDIVPNGVYTKQFTATGTYLYKCTIHAGMTGKVIVQ